MGYCVIQRDTEFRIENDRKQDALKALLDYELQWNAQHEKWCHKKHTSADSLEDLFGEWDWNSETDESGDIVWIGLDGDRLGDEDEWFEVLAPFVEAGSYIVMEGEDGYIWRYYFNGLTCVSETGRIVFDHEE